MRCLPSPSVLVACCLVSLPPGADGVFLKGMARPMLFFEEVLEIGDLVSSLLYVYQSHKRLYDETWEETRCSDGYTLQPVLTVECPTSGWLPLCDNAEQGARCRGGACVWQLDEFLPSARTDALRHRAWSTAMSLSSHAVAGLNEDHIAEFLLFIGFELVFLGVVVHAALAIGFGFALARYERLASLTLIAADLGATMILRFTFYVALFFKGSALWDEDDAFLDHHLDDSPYRKLNYALEVPIMNFMAIVYTQEEVAEKTMEYRRPFKWQLRLIQDIPELVVGSMEAAYFGASWWAFLDLAMSVLAICFHMWRPCAIACSFAYGCLVKACSCVCGTFLAFNDALRDGVRVAPEDVRSKPDTVGKTTRKTIT